MATCGDCDREIDDPMLDEESGYGLCSKCSDDLRAQVHHQERIARALADRLAQVMPALRGAREALGKAAGALNIIPSIEVGGETPGDFERWAEEQIEERGE